MRNHNILRHHSQHLTQRSNVKVTEPKTAKNVIFDGRYPLISSFTVRFTRKGHQTMRNHNILRHHSQHLTQRSKVFWSHLLMTLLVIFWLRDLDL